MAERLHVNSAGRKPQLRCSALLCVSLGWFSQLILLILSSSSCLTRVTTRLLHGLSLPPVPAPGTTTKMTTPDSQQQQQQQQEPQRPKIRYNLRNPLPLSASQEAEVQDLFHKRVRRHCAAEVKGKQAHPLRHSLPLYLFFFFLDGFLAN